ncbi:MAG: D-sedoheptulose 7-phosphate isomerase [Candidatus Gorgyraea atricola]|nr:D-sedoheptulose 7-phosphate isomerase [Candidatus Gorgyraea atricola]
MKKKIIELIKEDIEVKNALIKTQVSNIEALARMMLATVKSGNKILIFGNGGSAADSIHITAELVGRFRKEREALPAIALSTNVSTLTALGNDYGFEAIFERQVEALGKEGDMALGISTSGKSKNVIRAIEKASKMNMKTAVLIGKSKGALVEIADVSVNVPSNSTPRIQESHSIIGHIVCEIIEDAL